MTPLMSTFPLRLFHHYTTELSIVLPQTRNPAILAMWRIDAPQLAFECDYLLNSIFSLSALHIYCLRGPDDRGLKRAIRVYFDRSITSFQKALPTLGPDNAQQIFMTAVLLATLAKAASSPDTHESQSYTLPLFTFKLLKSLTPLMKKAETWLVRTNVAAFIQPLNQTNDSESQPLFRYIEEDARPELRAILIGVETGSPDWVAYAGAIYLTNILIDMTVKGAPVSTILRNYTLFAVLMSDDFMALLEKHDPRALIILGHHLALGCCLDSVWWVKNGSKEDVFGITTLLPEEWRIYMEWPIKLVKNPPTAQAVQSMPKFDLETEAGFTP
jgi:hypothetical protein